MKKEIVGYEAEKREMAKLREMLGSAAKFREMGIRLPRGVILCGEPGVGKTVLAQSIAGDGIKLYELKAASCCCDDAASAVKDIFKLAKSNTPCVILLDEIDKIAGASGSFISRTNDFVNKTLLQELDALPADTEILVVATCNEKDSLGPALTRSGRFDRIINIPKPDKNTRQKILEMYFSRIMIEKELNYEYLARTTAGLSGAALECVANESAIRAFENKHDVITVSDVQEVIDKMSFGTEAKAGNRNEENLRKVAVHEAGHCLAALMLYPDAVEGITILQRGNSGGHVSLCFPEDKATSVDDCENLITVALAGHVAERVILGTYFLGSSSDLQQAALMLKRLIIEEGVYGYEYIEAADAVTRAFVKATSTKDISKLQNEILTRLDKKAADLISENQKLFELIVNAVMERQSLSRDEILELRKEFELREAA